MALVGILKGKLTAEDATVIHNDAMINTRVVGKCVAYLSSGSVCSTSDNCSRYDALFSFMYLVYNCIYVLQLCTRL